MSRSACAIGKDVVPASFKGVGFYCTDANVEGGRRGAEGEFPFGEQTAYADLGRKIRIYHLTAVFREDDHVWDSQAVFEACQSPGPGILVHPTRGAVMVACRSIKVSDKLETDAGETTAEMEFVEANIGFSGIAGSIFGIISTGLLAASQTSFLRDYQPTYVAQPWRIDVIDKAQHLIATTATAATYTLTEDSAEREWREILAMQEVAGDDGLALPAANVDKALTTGFKIITRNVVDAKTKFDIFRNLVNAAVATATMPAGLAAVSENAVISRHRILGAVGMAEAAMGRKYTTIGDALATMDTVVVVLDDEARIAYDNCDNGLYLELRKYTIEFSKMMHDLSYRLPGVVRVNFSGGVHSLVAAYTIYRDAKRHRELEDRNVIDANGRMGPIVSGVAPT